jgi:peroxiredoxin
MQNLDEPVDLEQAVRMACSLNGSLNERLAFFAMALRRLNQPFAEAVDRLVDRLAGAQAGSSAPQVGELMPRFILPDTNGRLIAMEENLADGPAAIVFHRGHWCPYCHITNDALADFERRARSVGGRVVAITPDRQPFVAKFRAVEQSAFPILTDVDNGYALSLGLAIWVGDEMRGFMQSIGRDLGAYQGNDAWFLPIPASFVVGQNGVIVARHVNPDYRERMELEHLLAALKSASDQSD